MSVYTKSARLKLYMIKNTKLRGYDDENVEIKRKHNEILKRSAAAAPVVGVTQPLQLPVHLAHRAGGAAQHGAAIFHHAPLNAVSLSYGGPHLHWKAGYAAGGARVLTEPLRNARHEAKRAKPTAHTSVHVCATVAQLRAPPVQLPPVSYRVGGLSNYGDVVGRHLGLLGDHKLLMRGCRVHWRC